MSKKEHVGTVCGHHEEILEEGDCTCVEFEDVAGDVCFECFKEVIEIHDACNDKPEDENPYPDYYSDYWFKGTLQDFKTLLKEKYNR